MYTAFKFRTINKLFYILLIKINESENLLSFMKSFSLKITFPFLFIAYEGTRKKRAWKIKDQLGCNKYSVICYQVLMGSSSQRSPWVHTCIMKCLIVRYEVWSIVSFCPGQARSFRLARASKWYPQNGTLFLHIPPC